ncbi:hypothetical protein Q4543_21875 [Salipiger sp. 1_MG-2023]|nr:hypothetical protein [Salipiger sp. 1_MG-2023]MDO6588156.1 hypothetical protein [Salipiger sp. 1_MG-2023]
MILLPSALDPWTLHRHRPDPGHDFALRLKAVAHQTLAAFIVQQVGMLGNERQNVGLNRRAQEPILAHPEPRSASKRLGRASAHRAAKIGDEVLKAPGPAAMAVREAIWNSLAESRRGTVRRNAAEPLHRQAYLHETTMRWKILKVPDRTFMPA